MSGKRVLALYAAVLLGFAVVLCRLYFLAENHTYAARAEAQSTVRLSLPARRGSFYDHSGLLLTGLETRYLALCFPGENNYTRLYAFTDSAGQALLYRNRNRSAPFLLEVDRDLSGRGIRCFATARRCAEVPLCQHLIGYLDAEGRGTAGLEKALDSQLAGTKEHDTLVCAVTAQGRLRAGETPQLIRQDSSAVGVQLTISRPVQRAAEAVAADTMTSGCILVLDTATAAVRASVSVPGYDPDDLAASLDAPDSPFLNRALESYAVGSVFKPVLAAAALEQGILPEYECTGAVVVDGQIFRCAGGVPHGTVDMTAAQRLFYPAGAAAGGRDAFADVSAAWLRAGGAGGRCAARRCRKAAVCRGACPERPAGKFQLWAGRSAGITGTDRRHDEHHCFRRGVPHAVLCVWLGG
jgi:hypothetical protein